MSSKPLIDRTGLVTGLITNLLGTLLIFLLVIFYYDRVKYPPLNMNGKWTFTMSYEKTARNPFQDMQVVYDVILIQHGTDIKGYGQKFSTQTSGQQVATEHSGSDRVEIEIEGVVHEGIVYGDTVNLFYHEKGEVRSSATFHELVRVNATEMKGRFESTIANSSGPVTWNKFTF